MTVKRRVVCVGAMAFILLGTNLGVGMWSLQPVAKAEDVPLVPSPCSLEGAWIMTILGPQGPQIQTVTFTAQTERPDLFTAVMESAANCPTPMSAMTGKNHQSRFVGLAKTGPHLNWQLTVMGYRLTQDRTGHQSPLVTVISSDTLHCMGLDVMEAKVSIATYLLRQNADRIGLPSPDEKPVACISQDAMFRRVPLMLPCEPLPATESIVVQVGDEFTVSLESNPTTGFAWTLVEVLPDWLEQTDYQYKPSVHEPGMVGSGGIDEWTYRAKAAGATTLLYVYRQPWISKEVPPEKTYSVQVIAEEPVSDE